MAMLRYDEAANVHALGRLEKDARVAFAASCATRLFPSYGEFCDRSGRGDPATLSAILERVWRRLLGDPAGSEPSRADLERCMALIPGEDDEPWIAEQAYAEDAGSAIAYALRTLDSGEPQEAAWAARRAYEAADHHVMHRLGIEGEAQVMAHAIVQAELSRQRRDLEELLAAGGASSGLFPRLRERAIAEGVAFFADDRH